MSDAPELWLTLFSAVALAASWRRARLPAPEGADTAGSFRPWAPPQHHPQRVVPRHGAFPRRVVLDGLAVAGLTSCLSQNGGHPYERFLG